MKSAILPKQKDKSFSQIQNLQDVRPPSEMKAIFRLMPFFPAQYDAQAKVMAAQALHAEPEKLVRLQRALVAEIETAKTMNAAATTVVYGAQVMIQHVESELYLTMTGDRAHQDGCLMCKLQPDGPKSGFTVTPGYRSSALGDNVQYGHGLNFLHDILKSYLHVATPRTGKLADCQPTQDSAITHDYVQTIIECNGLNKASVIVARPFRLSEQASNEDFVVRGCDAITLFSTESNRQHLQPVTLIGMQRCDNIY